MEVTYDRIGNGYSNFRSTDPDIAVAVRSALGRAASVVNVGAGTGSYEACALACIAIVP